MVLDLDPDPSVPWKDVVAAARTVRGRLEQIGLHAFVKTTGGKGLHVCCAFQTSWDEMKMLARAIAESIVRDEPDRYVATMSKARRKGKIFIDHFRNGRGSTFVAPFSLRARPGAPVAMPLAWEELSARAKPDHFTLANVEARLERLGTQGDPWRSLGDMRRTRARDPSRRPVAQR
jgi:bifunctional non-homologous end joining protein LigD